MTRTATVAQTPIALYVMKNLGGPSRMSILSFSAPGNG
jgi:hypothetical protein